MPLGSLIKNLQDIMRQDPGIDGDTHRYNQLFWMLFLKVFDEREAERELFDDSYRSPIPEKLRWRNWAKGPAAPKGDALIDFINNELFKTLKELPTSGENDTMEDVVRGVFEDGFNYMKSGTLMRKVIHALEELDLNRTADRLQFGDIYERNRSPAQAVRAS